MSSGSCGLVISMRLTNALAVVVGIGLVLSGHVHAQDSWAGLLAKARRHTGDTWCGTVDGRLHLGSRIFTVFGYQIVVPGSEDLVIQLVPENIPSSERSELSRLLRITHQGAQWTLQETGREPRPIVPSAKLRQALRFGMAYGLPSFHEDSSIEIALGDVRSTIQVQTKQAIILLPGLEGKIRLVLDRDTGKPLKLQAFGLREWQGREIQDYKLGLTFVVVPGCHHTRPSPKRDVD